MSTPQRVATIDVGTNTALLLVAERSADGMRVCETQDRFVRLGAGVDERRIIRDEAMERLRIALLDFIEVAEDWEVEAIVVAATSASRDARNVEDLVQFVRFETGLTYEILSGEEEALWSFNGALSALPATLGRVVTLDIGGGSTERVYGEWDAGASVWRVVDARSFDVGSVRLTERFFAGQPPASEAVLSAGAWIREMIPGEALDLPADTPWIGASGTSTSLALLEAGVSTWSELPDPRPSIHRERIGAWRNRLLGMTYEEVLALDPNVMNGRADVFPAGVLILDTLLGEAGVTRLECAHRGLRHGLALRYWRDEQGAG